MLINAEAVSIVALGVFAVAFAYIYQPVPAQRCPETTEVIKFVQPPAPAPVERIIEKVVYKETPPEKSVLDPDPIAPSATPEEETAGRRHHRRRHHRHWRY